MSCIQSEHVVKALPFPRKQQNFAAVDKKN